VFCPDGGDAFCSDWTVVICPEGAGASICPDGVVGFHSCGQAAGSKTKTIIKIVSAKIWQSNATPLTKCAVLLGRLSEPAMS
jgi:hypothetical protein